MLFSETLTVLLRSRASLATKSCAFSKPTVFSHLNHVLCIYTLVFLRLCCWKTFIFVVFQDLRLKSPRIFTIWLRRQFQFASILRGTGRTRIPNSGWFLLRAEFTDLLAITRKLRSSHQCGNSEYFATHLSLYCYCCWMFFISISTRQLRGFSCQRFILFLVYMKLSINWEVQSIIYRGIILIA